MNTQINSQLDASKHVSRHHATYSFLLPSKKSRLSQANPPNLNLSSNTRTKIQFISFHFFSTRQSPMASSAAATFLLPAQTKQTLDLKRINPLFFVGKRRAPANKRRGRSIVPVARLFGPAIFESSKLKVLFVGDVDEEKHPGKLPRTYTLTHSDITSKLTLAISNTINRAQLQGWYNRLQRDEVVAEWKKVKGKMSLHVQCHISGGHFLLDLIANLRYYIFSKELPVVLKAFVHGDENLFNKHPELVEAPVYVYFHSNLPQFNRVECWGPLRDATATGRPIGRTEDCAEDVPALEWPERCQTECECCFPPRSLIPWPREYQEDKDIQSARQPQQNQ